MDVGTALSILEDAVTRCRLRQEIPTAEVQRALDFLARGAFHSWPIDQFRKALERSRAEEFELQGQYQVLNASLNAIKLTVRK
jgi:hypothetical protein